MGLAQCSITLGNDTTICQGGTATLVGPPGYSNYSWSNGPTTQNNTVGAAGNYTCTVSYPTGNLVTNGNFSAGNSGFTNQFPLDFNMQNEPSYNVGPNANWYHPQWNCTGNGNFLMINAGWAHSGYDAWCQTIPVCPGQTYTLVVRAASLAAQGAPLLNWVIDGVGQSMLMQTAASQGTWTQFTNSWTSGPGQYSASFCIEVSSSWGVGNDFALDDISISSTIVLSDQQQVFVTPLPSVSLGPDQLGCTGDLFPLNAFVPGATYIWQDGSTNPTFNVTGAGIYDVDVTLNGCTANDAVQFWYNPYPALDLGNDTTLCAGQTLPMNVFTLGATYQWQNGSPAPSYTVVGPGTYDVDLTLNGCTAQDTIVVSYNPLPGVALGNDTALCDGEQMLLDATTAGATYVWQDGTTASSFNVGSAGVYDVDVTVSGCTANDAITVTFTPLPALELGNDTTVCPGEIVTWDASLPGATYLWNDLSTGSSLTTSTPGSSSVTVTLNGCSSWDGAMLSNFNLQSVNLGNDLIECAGTPVPLSVNVPGATYLWNTNATSNSISVSTTGTYWVEATLNGCTVRDSINVSFTPLPVFSLGNDTSVCPGGAILLDATLPGASYLWSNNSVGATVNAGPGVWSVLVAVNGCSSTDTITVGTWLPPVVSLGNDTTLCPGASMILDATLSGAGYLWQDNSTASTFTVNTAGNYDVTVTDANGCTGSDAITVGYANPGSVFLGNDTTICLGTFLTLDATLPGATYLWSTSAVTPTISVGSGGNYSVVVTQGQCTVADAITVSTAPNPNVSLPNDTTLCAGETLLLNATTPGVSYTWQDGSTSPTFLVSSPAAYTVTVTNANGCTDNDGITVSYAVPGSIDLGNDTSFCAGGNVLLDATLPGSSYTWSTGATSATLNASTSGTYWVEALQGNCAVSDTIVVAVNANPSVTLPNDTTLCPGETLLLDVTTAGVSYAWQDGSTAATFLVNSAGNFSVTVTTANGCADNNAILVYYAGAGSIALGNDTSFCSGGSALLDATLAGSTYTWSTGATSATITASTSGTYWVEALQGNCAVSDTIVVTVDPVPNVALPNDTTLCVGATLLLDATTPGVTYLWQDGSTNSTFLVIAAGNYSVTVASANGCTDNDAITVNYASAGAINIGNDTTICQGDSIMLDATLPGATYLWSTGAASASIMVGFTGPYSVIAQVGACSVYDTVQVIMNMVPLASSWGNDTTFCYPGTYWLPVLPADSYLWQDGSTGSSFVADQTGLYWVEALYGQCAYHDSINIVVEQPLPIDLGMDTAICLGTTVLLDATWPGATYLWNTSATTATLAASPPGAYVDVTVNGCTWNYDIGITALPTPTVDLGNDSTLCNGSTITLSAAQPGATYQWQDGSAGATYTTSTDVEAWVDVDLNGCAASDSVNIYFLSPAAVDLGPDTTVCQGASVTLGSPLPGVQYAWSTGSNAPTIIASSAGTYWLNAGIPGCMGSDTIVLAVVQIPQPELGPDLTACEGDTVQLTVIPGAANVLWSDGSNGASIVATASGSVGVQLLLNGCSASDAVEVTFVPTIDVLSLGPDVQHCPGEPLQLDATIAGAAYIWSTGQVSPTITITEPATYWVEVSGSCISASDTIVVAPGDCGLFIYVPNTFTPDGDGFNDMFSAVVTGDLISYSLILFDRWGAAVWETNDPSATWDGVSAGVRAPDGVYVWTIRYKADRPDGIKQERLMGHVTLLR